LEALLRLFIEVADETIAQWFLYSGISQHMSTLKNLFQNYSSLENPKTIYLGDNSFHQAIGKDLVLLQLQIGQPLLIPKVCLQLG
jgi:hypothetical protein